MKNKKLLFTFAVVLIFSSYTLYSLKKNTENRSATSEKIETASEETPKSDDSPLVESNLKSQKAPLPKIHETNLGAPPYSVIQVHVLSSTPIHQFENEEALYQGLLPQALNPKNLGGDGNPLPVLILAKNLSLESPPIIRVEPIGILSKANSQDFEHVLIALHESVNLKKKNAVDLPGEIRKVLIHYENQGPWKISNPMQAVSIIGIANRGFLSAKEEGF